MGSVDQKTQSTACGVKEYYPAIMVMQAVIATVETTSVNTYNNNKGG